jgi:hypothetical protein
MTEQATKTCPKCAETVKAQAVICRYCDHKFKDDKDASRAGWIPIFGIVTIVLMIFYVLGVFNTSNDSRSSSSSRTQSSTSPPSTYSIRYRVRGKTTIGRDADASITYFNQSGNMEQIEVRLPWTKSLKAKPGQILGVTAQVQTKDSSITCEIYQDDKLIEKADSSGDFVIAMCNGLAGD